MKISTFIVCSIIFIACDTGNSGFAPKTGDSGLDNSENYSSERHVVGDYSIDIYYPDNYNSSIAYPVIYFNDGDHFSYVFTGLYDVRPGEFIMVGLHGGGDRTSLYVPYDDPWIIQNWGAYTPKAQDYSLDLVQTIIPYVEDLFSVDENRRAIFGISLGGLHAAWQGIHYPDHFSFVGAISPSFWVADYALFRESLGGISYDNTFYFDMGTREWNYYVPFIGSLKLAGLTYGEEIFYYEVVDGTHTSGSWVDRIHIPFLIFLEQGNLGNPTGYSLEVECIASLSTPGLFFQRLNPIVHFEDDLRYSLTTEASYELLSGDGQVTTDGRWLVDEDGMTMTVRVSYGNWSQDVELINCQ